MSQPEQAITPDPIVDVDPEPEWKAIHMRCRPTMISAVDFIVRQMERDPCRIIETIGRTDACRKAVIEYARQHGWSPEDSGG